MTKNGSFLQKRWNRILLSAGTVAVCFLLASLFCSITFLNNDDVSIQRALAGWQTGDPYVAHPFLNILLSAPVSWLYRFFPAIAWWGRLQQAAMFVSLTVLGCCLFLAFDRANKSVLAAEGTFLCLLLGTFSYAFARITFTLTAATLGCAAVAVLLTDDPARPASFLRLLSAPVLLFFAFLFRNSSGICLLPFVLLAAAYRAVYPICAPCAIRSYRIRQAFVIGFTVLLSALAIGANAFGRVRFNAPGYETFDAARSAFADYPHASYAEDPALYEKLGWDETLCDLAASWCFLDERINAGTLSAIAAASVPPRTIMQKLIAALESGVALARGNGPVLWLLALPIGTFLLSILLSRSRRGARLPLLCSFFFAFGSFLLCGYLCYTGRFLLRTFTLIAFPATVGILLLLLEIAACPIRRTPHRRLLTTAAALLLLPVLACGVCTCRMLVLYEPGESVTRAGEMYAYAIAHPEHIYIRDSYSINDVDAFRTFPNERPVNLIDWGGNGMYTGALLAQLERNGLSALNQDTLLMDPVYVITTAGSAQEVFLLRYAADTLSADTVEKIDAFGDRFVVYIFRKDA